MLDHVGLICFGDEVAAARARGAPLVALESTIITHGMAWPANLATARAVEARVRAAGAVPATIAVLRGRLCVGLSEAELEGLARRGHAVSKCSRRDLAVCVAQREDGSTTVAATMVIAAMAGIRVFVTGGVGGVHRGDPFDVSADLTELGRTGGLAVVCSGAKSILDVRATLEVLETQGVTVITMGGQKEFPAFFTRKSAFPSHVRADSLSQVAAIVQSNIDLRLNSGILVAVPVPEADEAPASVEQATEQAVKEAHEQGVAGKDVTPFLLARIAQLTGDESLKSNVALILNNAQVGAELAVLLAQQGGEKKAPLAVVGGAARDVSYRSESAFVAGESNVCSDHSSYSGGVARNVAECLARLSSAPVRFASLVGDDAAGQAVCRELRALGVDVSAVVTLPHHPTASYCSFIGADGELAGAMAAMDIFNHPPSNPFPVAQQPAPAALLMDCNFPASFIRAQLALFHGSSTHCWIDPTSEAKCLRALPSIREGLVYGIAPNDAEFDALSKEASLLDHVQVVLRKRGAAGVEVLRRGKEPLRVPAPRVERIVSVTGCWRCVVGSRADNAL